MIFRRPKVAQPTPPMPPVWALEHEVLPKRSLAEWGHDRECEKCFPFNRRTSAILLPGESVIPRRRFSPGGFVR